MLEVYSTTLGHTALQRQLLTVRLLNLEVAIRTKISKYRNIHDFCDLGWHQYMGRKSQKRDKKAHSRSNAGKCSGRTRTVVENADGYENGRGEAKTRAKEGRRREAPR